MTKIVVTTVNSSAQVFFDSMFAESMGHLAAAEHNLEKAKKALEGIGSKN